MTRGIAYALAAALLFGASTPFAKLLVGSLPPILLAGLLYAGAGVGLLLWYLLQRLLRTSRQTREAPLSSRDLPWLAAAIVSGGIAGPILLLYGLRATPGSTAALLLNLEGVFTALLAWFIFHENVDRRVATGMALIIAGGALLSWQGSVSGAGWGAIAVTAACLCWAVDNNLTRRVSAADPLQIAGVKGLIAGAINLGLAYATGAVTPSAGALLSASLVGFFGYGVSLALFVLALRGLGTARTGAYFSVAPFVGAALALPLLGEHPGGLFWVAAVLMAIGIWLHLSERHEHRHRHEAMAHAHRHVHDEHHQHRHDFPWDGREPHTHYHPHRPLVHSHPHYPDIHHRHRHAPDDTPS